jgi:hypothetical protein
MLFGDWRELGFTLKEMRKLAQDNMAMATRTNAVYLRDKMKDRIRKGDPTWPPLSAMTVERKGDNKILWEYGELYNAIVRFMFHRFHYFVGVLPGKENKYGQDLYQVMVANEYGKLLRPKRARMLAIPVSEEARELAHRYGSVGGIPGTFSPKGSRILYQRKGPGHIVPLFILKSFVIIPPRSLIAKTFRRERRKLESRFVRAADDAVHRKKYLGQS